MPEFKYRTLTPAELRTRQRTCHVLKENKMACNNKAKMRIAQTGVANGYGQDYCMYHFVQAITKARNTENLDIINLDQFSTPQDLQVERTRLEAEKVKKEKTKNKTGEKE